MRKVRSSCAATPGGALCCRPGRKREFCGSRKSAMPLCSVGARLGREGFHVIGQSREMHGPVIEARLTRTLHPHEGVLHPVLIVAAREVLARLRAAALGAIG